jgi:hypothetical protein
VASRGSNGDHSLPFRASEPILCRSILVPTLILNAAPPLASLALFSLGHIFIIVKPIANELPVLALPWCGRRRPCAHVTVIPAARVAVNAGFLCAAPGALAFIGVAAVTGTQSGAQRVGSCTCAADSHAHVCGFEVRMAITHFRSALPNPYAVEAYLYPRSFLTPLHHLQAWPFSVLATSSS